MKLRQKKMLGALVLALSTITMFSTAFAVDNVTGEFQYNISKVSNIVNIGMDLVYSVLNVYKTVLDQIVTFATIIGLGIALALLIGGLKSIISPGNRKSRFLKR